MDKEVVVSTWFRTNIDIQTMFIEENLYKCDGKVVQYRKVKSTGEDQKREFSLNVTDTTEGNAALKVLERLYTFAGSKDGGWETIQ
jgi:hypothetical protein